MTLASDTSDGRERPVLAGFLGKLTARQERAILALVAFPTLAKAAQQAGVGERTLRRWLATPAFVKRYQQARACLMDRVLAGLQAGCHEGVIVLRGILQKAAATDTSKISAARTLLERCFIAQEAIQLDARVAKIEEAFTRRRR